MSEEDKDRAPLSASDWERVKKVFREAIAIGPEDREEFVQSSCAGDTELIAEIDSLLASFERASEFLETPAIQEIATQFEDQKPQLKSGELLAHYRIVAKIGSGGMGEVYLADDTKLDRKVAIKLLNRSLAEDRSSLKRFLREAKIASGLNHPNIMTVHEVGESADKHYLVCEFIEGEILRKRIRGSRVRLRESVDLLIQIASALEAAHKMGIVHRDIKPENVMVRKDGIAKVLDFGLAKPSKSAVTSSDPKERAKTALTTQKGMILGTVAYMSPEQTRGKKTDARSDIWSFGVLLFQLVSGRLPFDGETTSDVLASVLKSDPDPLSELVPGIPEELEKIARKCLRKKASKRYQNAEELLDDLRNLKNELDKTDPGDLELTRSLRPEDGDRETDRELTEPTDGRGGDLLTRISSMLSVRIPSTGTGLLGAFAVLAGLIGISAYTFLFSGEVYLFETQKIIAPDGRAGDTLGRNVAIEDDVLVITSAANYEDNTNAGVAYLYSRENGRWEFIQHLTPESDSQDFAGFGSSVDISGDTMIIGASLYDNPGYNEGAAYVFVRDGIEWVQQQKLVPSDPQISYAFGESVAVEGDIAVVGANKGAAYVFERDGEEWEQKQKLTAFDNPERSDDQFGIDVDISGDTIVVGAYRDAIDLREDQGSAYVYSKTKDTWELEQKLVASEGASGDNFGLSVEISDDLIFVGAPFDSVGKNADQGSVYVFSRKNGEWTEVATLRASDGEEEDVFGDDIAVDGNRLLVGAYRDETAGHKNRGSAYLFERSVNSPHEWIEKQKILSSDGAAEDQFSVGSVALWEDTAIVGASSHDVLGAINAGSVYSFDLGDGARVRPLPSGIFTYFTSFLGKENRLPIADAGEGITARPKGVNWAWVTLDGGGSSDPDGDPLAYKWEDEHFETLSGVSRSLNIPLGTHKVILTAEDGNGGVSSDVLFVYVRYEFNGFFQPVDDIKLNVVKAGGGVPLEFSLGYDYGDKIIEPGFPVSHEEPCPNIEVNQNPILTENIESDILTYDNSSKRYKLIWKTKEEWVGTCRHFALRLNDGNTHTMHFRFE